MKNQGIMVLNNEDYLEDVKIDIVLKVKNESYNSHGLYLEIYKKINGKFSFGGFLNLFISAENVNQNIMYKVKYEILNKKSEIIEKIKTPNDLSVWIRNHFSDLILKFIEEDKKEKEELFLLQNSLSKSKSNDPTLIIMICDCMSLSDDKRIKDLAKILDSEDTYNQDLTKVIIKIDKTNFKKNKVKYLKSIVSTISLIENKGFTLLNEKGLIELSDVLSVKILPLKELLAVAINENKSNYPYEELLDYAKAEYFENGDGYIEVKFKNNISIPLESLIEIAGKEVNVLNYDKNLNLNIKECTSLISNSFIDKCIKVK